MNCFFHTSHSTDMYWLYLDRYYNIWCMNTIGCRNQFCIRVWNKSLPNRAVLQSQAEHSQKLLPVPANDGAQVSTQILQGTKDPLATCIFCCVPLHRQFSSFRPMSFPSNSGELLKPILALWEFNLLREGCTVDPEKLQLHQEAVDNVASYNQKCFFIQLQMIFLYFQYHNLQNWSFCMIAGHATLCPSLDPCLS